jgi:hypothetical protein
MKQKFSKQDYEKFKKYFSIKNSPSEVDIKYLNKTKKYLSFIKWIP